VGTPSRNILYRDDECVIIGEKEVDGRFFIHSILGDPSKPSSIRKYRNILDELGKQLKDRGYDSFYTMADSLNGFRFNKMLGFEPAYEVWNDELEIMVKEL
jgi:hypothetical protein